VPNEATPDTVTAGPAGSFTGAERSLRVYCARASLTSDDENVDRIENAAV
jgi:hypothetical protein